MSLFQRVCRLSWPRFLALLTLLLGIWLTCLFAAYLIPTVTGHPDFQNDESGLAEGAALVIFPMVGLSSCALSYFLARRKNWARLTLVAVLGLACAAATAILGSRLLTWRFSTPDEIGEFVLAVGFLIIPLAVVAFLVNDQVAAAFRADLADTQRGETR
jgi:hypothetical protein